MPGPIHRTPSLRGWTVLSLRPRGQHAGMRAAARRHGARTLALSVVAIERKDDAPTRDALRGALRAGIVVYTSPNAVAAAAALATLHRRGTQVLAVGDGTRRALQREGVDALAPSRMDSEGVLSMPQLGDIEGHRIGLVTGAGGRNLLAPALRARAADVQRVDVYARAPIPLSARTLERLRSVLSDPRRVLLGLGSGEALQRLRDGLPPDLRTPLADIAVVAASARLAEAAHDAGFHRIAVASDARAASLLRAGAEAFT